MAAIEERSNSLEAELSRCQEQLAEQRQRLQEVHATQESQLDSLRTAGHDTLALVVEQYKVRRGYCSILQVAGALSKRQFLKYLQMEMISLF